MADDPSKRGPADRSRININEAHETRYWTERFGVSDAELREAVQRVGVMAADVERFLSNRPSGSSSPR